jgi:hypothetical protein
MKWHRLAARNTYIYCYRSIGYYQRSFYLEYDVSEIQFCPRLHVEYTQLGTIDRASIHLVTSLSIEPN